MQTRGNLMKPGNKLKPQTPSSQQTRRKTKDDFLLWLKKRREPEKLEVEEKRAEAAQEMKQALAVWVDDGGTPA
jgi:hypothetical protein